MIFLLGLKDYIKVKGGKVTVTGLEQDLYHLDDENIAPLLKLENSHML